MNYSPIQVRTSRVNPERLGRLLDGNEFGSDHNIVIEDGDLSDSASVLRVPDTLDGDPTFWAAGCIRRRLRAVSNPEDCRSPGLEKVLESGHWQHPTPPDKSPGLMEGVLFFKPRMKVSPRTLAELELRCAESGYVVRTSRVVSGLEIAEFGLGNAHYLPHSDLAAHGQLTCHEYAALLTVYDSSEFVARFGVPPQAVQVLPVDRFIAKFGVSRDLIIKWSNNSAARRGLNSGAVDGPNEIGDYLFVNVFCDPSVEQGRPFFLINPHMPQVLDELAALDARILVFHLQARSNESLSWVRMRREFCGETDPTRALPGSLRGDAHAGFFPLEGIDGAPVCRTNNGVHLSNGALEALRELGVWFGNRPTGTATGQALVAKGVDPEEVVRSPYLVYIGRRRVVAEATKRMDVASAAGLLRNSRLSDGRGLGANPHTLRRISIARQVAQELAAQGGVAAVLATGSVARDRASRDSDLDLLVLGAANAGITTRRVDGVTVELNRVSIEHVRQQLAPHEASLKELREASRIGTAVAIFDPETIGPELVLRANALRPSLDIVRDRLVRVLATMADLGTDPSLDVVHRWEILRCVVDNLAMIALSLHPLRYQKAKWVADDLGEIGEGALRFLLLKVNNAENADANAAREALHTTRAFLDAVSVSLRLPDSSTTVAMGHAPHIAGWSYTARTLADAKSLAEGEHWHDAVYTARFASRLAVSCCSRARDDLPSRPPATRILERTSSGTLTLAYNASSGIPKYPPDRTTLEEVVSATYRICRRLNDLDSEAHKGS